MSRRPIKTLIKTGYRLNMDNPIQNFGLKEAAFEQLVGGLRQGDEQLFETIFVEHFGSCRSYLMRECSANSEDAYDMTVETIIVFRQMLIDGKIKYGNLRFYFTKMAKDAYLKVIAKQKRTPIGTFNPVEDDRAEEITESFDEEQITALTNAWSKLGDDCQNLLRKHVQEGFQLKLIAASLNETEANMRKRKERCMAKLKGFFFEVYTF